MATGNATDTNNIGSGTTNIGSGTQQVTPPPPTPPSEETGRRIRELHDNRNKTAEQILNEQ